MEEELEKIVKVGEKLGLKGDKLLEYLNEKERAKRKTEEEKLQREERAAEREAKRVEKEISLQISLKESENKLALLDKEIQLEKIKVEAHALELSSKQASAPIVQGNLGQKFAKLPKLPSFNDEKDCIDAYLQRFERFAENAKWEKDTWSINLSALLTGTALEVYSRLSPTDALDYDKLKVSLLQRFRLSEEGFHDKFRGSKPDKGENPPQFVARLENYLTRWIELAKSPPTFEGLKDLLLREQFIVSCSKSLATFLRERHPKNVQEMTMLAEQFIEAHGSSSFVSDRSSQKLNVLEDVKPSTVKQNGRFLGGGKSDRKCYECGRTGHIARDCFDKIEKENSGHRGAGLVEEYRPRDYTRGSRLQNQGKFDKRDTYQNTRGSSSGNHVGSFCILSDKLGNCCVQNNQVTLRCGHVLPVIGGACRICHNMSVADGYVGEKCVQVLRDSGCSGVVVKHDLVSPDQFTGKSLECVLIDGTVRKVPEAYISIHTPFYSGSVKALCMHTPVYDLIIGNVEGAKDVTDPDPDWNKISRPGISDEGIKNPISEPVECSAVQTRGQVKKEQQRYKELKVVDISGNNISVQDMLVAQNDDTTLNRYRIRRIRYTKVYWSTKCILVHH